MLPIAFSLKGTGSLVLAVGFFVFMNIRDKYYGMVTYEILNKYSMLDSIRVTQDHKVRSALYFCPEYCGVNHAHFAHLDTFKCDSSCDHYTYKIDKVLRLKDDIRGNRR